MFGVFHFSILLGKLVSITVFALFSHDYFSVFEQQHKRGTVQTSKGMCEDLGQPSSSTQCVTLTFRVSEPQKTIYLVVFLIFWWWTLFILLWILSHKHIFSSLQLLTKKFTKRTLCKQYIIVWNVKLYIFLKFDKNQRVKIKNCKLLITSVAAVFRWLLLRLLALAPLRCRLIASRVSEQLYFSWFYTFRKRTQSQGGKSGELDRWWAKPECLRPKIPTVQIVASESAPSDTSGCHSRTLYPQPCAGERIHDAQPDKCWKKMQSILLSFLNLMCCLWTGNCLVIAKDSALITNDDHPWTLDQFKVKVDVCSLH